MRKSKPKKRILLPDPKYHEVLVTQFVNNLMLQGSRVRRVSRILFFTTPSIWWARR